MAGRPRKTQLLGGYVSDLLTTPLQKAIYKKWVIYFNPYNETDTELLQLYICVLYNVMIRYTNRAIRLEVTGSYDFVPVVFGDLFAQVCNGFEIYLEGRAVNVMVKFFTHPDQTDPEIVGFKIENYK